MKNRFENNRTSQKCEVLLLLIDPSRHEFLLVTPPREPAWRAGPKLRFHVVLPLISL